MGEARRLDGRRLGNPQHRGGGVTFDLLRLPPSRLSSEVDKLLGGEGDSGSASHVSTWCGEATCRTC